MPGIQAVLSASRQASSRNRNETYSQGAKVKTITPTTNQSAAKSRPYPKKLLKSTCAIPATTTYQKGDARFPM